MLGVTVTPAGSAALVVLEVISDEYKAHLRSELAAYCYGATNIADAPPEYYSFERTIKEFLIRYDAKPTTTKIGMAGELVIHSLMGLTHPELTSSAVFLNKEERSIKKGFDLTFHAAVAGRLWYGEVKSGEVASGETADQKSTALIHSAARDIADKLGPGAQRSRWDSALIDAQLTLESSLARTVKALLRTDVTSIEELIAIEKNVVLAATVMHAIEHCLVSIASVVAVAANIARDGRFSSVNFLVVQQSDIEAVIAYLREVADGTAN